MKIVIFLSVLCLSLFGAGESSWSFLKQLKLKKDQISYIKWIENESVFHMTLRWTLFKNGGLVVLMNKNGFPTQHVLYKKRDLDSLSFQLVPDIAHFGDRVYLLIKFDSFKLVKNVRYAFLDISIKDPKQRVLVEFYDPSKNKNGEQ